MSREASTESTTKSELTQEIAVLAQAVAKLPADERRKIEPLVVGVVESSQRRRRILNLVQDALSQLRLDMKYLVFDLEATRRERDEFKRLAEQDDNTDNPE